MSRDYKPAPKNSSSGSKGSPFFAGLLIGLLLGVGISVAVTVFIKGRESPFVSKGLPATKNETENSNPSANPDATQPKDANAAKDPTGKPRFDFYTILPGTESKVTEQEIKQKETQPEAASNVKESYFLQVGAFQTEQEADNMKAKLALQGLEAIVQTATIPDKGVWHRVRVGPFTDLDQINKARSELTRNGFNADLIKVSSNTPDQ